MYKLLDILSEIKIVQLTPKFVEELWLKFVEKVGSQSSTYVNTRKFLLNKYGTYSVKSLIYEYATQSQLRDIWKYLIKIMEIYDKGHLDEIKVISKTKFPKNVPWIYKINDQKEYIDILTILKNQGYKWISCEHIMDRRDYSHFPCIISNNVMNGYEFPNVIGISLLNDKDLPFYNKHLKLNF